MKYDTWLNMLRGKPVRVSANGTKWFSLISSLLVALLCGIVAASALAGPSLPVGEKDHIQPLHVPELEAGFHLLYQWKTAEAHAQFEAWQKTHPEDPLGSASDAAAYLFEEFYRQGVLTSEFFLDNKRFVGKIALQPNPEMRAAFFAADKRAQDLARLRLSTNPKDKNALFAMTLSLGMQADYASLIDKHQVESLKMIGDADKYARQLLVIAPEGTDAYLTLGMANYIIGSLSRLRWRSRRQGNGDPAARDGGHERPLFAAVCKNHAGADGTA